MPNTWTRWESWKASQKRDGCGSHVGFTRQDFDNTNKRDKKFESWLQMYQGNNNNPHNTVSSASVTGFYSSWQSASCCDVVGFFFVLWNTVLIPGSQREAGGCFEPALALTLRNWLSNTARYPTPWLMHPPLHPRHPLSSTYYTHPVIHFTIKGLQKKLPRPVSRVAVSTNELL